MHIMKEILEYLKTKAFWKSLGIVVGLILILVMILMLYIRIYTHHGRSIAIPDLRDLPVADAAKYIKDKHLRYEIFDSIYVADKEKGVVIDQHPKPGFLVKKDRKIYLTINASSPDKIMMPYLIGITLREARAKIIASGLRVGNLSYRYDIAKNVVLDQLVKGISIQKNDTVLKGTAIDLVLGKGLADERTMVPELIGLTVEQAKNKASDEFFSLGAIIHDESINEENESLAVVIRQRPLPSPDILVPLGSPIDLWITTDSTKIGAGTLNDSTDLIWQDLNEDENAESTEDGSYTDDYNQ
jgi:eukaryotic-like serine/threonine-protein kinase